MRGMYIAALAADNAGKRADPLEVQACALARSTITGSEGEGGGRPLDLEATHSGLPDKRALRGSGSAMPLLG